MAKQAQTPVLDANGVAIPTPEKPKRTLVLVSMSIPQAMKDILDKIAEQESTTTANVARQRLAQVLDFTLPAMKRERSKKYATPAEAKAATAAKQRERNSKASALLAALEAGELGADLDAILAKFAPKPRTPKAAPVEATTEAVATA